MTRKSSKNKGKAVLDWGKIPTLTPEQTIEWLDGFRRLMFEIWRSNPKQIPSEKKKLLKMWLKRT